MATPNQFGHFVTSILLGCLFTCLGTWAVTPGEREAESRKSEYIYYPKAKLKAKIVKVDDGDSIFVDIYSSDDPKLVFSKNEEVRFTGFDAPETHMIVGKYENGKLKIFSFNQKDGLKAAEYLKTLIKKGDIVELVIPDVSGIVAAHPKVHYKTLAKAQRDVYGRLIAMVFSLDRNGKRNVFIQEEMAKTGQGYYYHYKPQDDPTKSGVLDEKYFEFIRKAAMSAKKQGIGVWSLLPKGGHRLFPHEFRRISRNSPARGYAGCPETRQFVSLEYIRVFDSCLAGVALASTFRDMVSLGFSYRVVDPLNADKLVMKTLTDLESVKVISKTDQKSFPIYNMGPVIKPNSTLKAKLVRILDGDTVGVVIPGINDGPKQSDISVRMVNNDTPESVFRINNPQPGGKESSVELANILGVKVTPTDEIDGRKKGFFKVVDKNGKVIGTSLDVVLKVSGTPMDVNGRVIADILIDKSENMSGPTGRISLNFEMSKSGFSWPVFYWSPNTDWGLWERYRDIFDEAIKNGQGLFSEKGLKSMFIHETPFQFRHRLDNRPCERIIGVINPGEGGNPRIDVYSPKSCDEIIPRPEQLIGGNGTSTSPEAIKKLIDSRRNVSRVIQFGSESALSASMIQNKEKIVLSDEFRKVLLPMPQYIH